MIKLSKGNLIEAKAEALVNTVNTVGIMGKGIALQFKQAYPENFSAYQKACKAGEVRTGKMFIYSTSQMVNPRYIINFPTKRHWKEKSKIEYIETGLADLIAEVKRLRIKTIAVPPLGCGSGGLDWNQVRPMIEKAFSQVPEVEVLLFSPEGAPNGDKMPVHTKKPNLTRLRAMLLKLINRYGDPGYRVSNLEIQKLAYFLQTSGEDLKLDFIKDKYGPYAEKLNYVLQKLEGHYLRGYGDRSRDAQIRLLPNAVQEAEAFLKDDQEAASRLEHISQLIEGFETPYGMELLSTVHWVAKHESPPATDEASAIKLTHDWNERKARLFKPDHIRIAWNRLKHKNYL